MQSPPLPHLAMKDEDFYALLDRLPLGVAMLDAERRLLFMNKALEGLTGFSRAEVEGVPCSNVLRAGHCVRRCQALPEKETPNGACAGFEDDIITRHRRKTPVRITQLPIWDETGALVRRFDFVEDISLFKEMEKNVERSSGFGKIIGRGEVMERILRILPAVAQSDSPVLITGETGTGKDLMAEALHRASPRSRGPFVRINCGPMPSALLDSELFGQKKGTGPEAEASKPGKFQIAHNGTLYISEIGDLPLEQQGKLLRFLDEQRIQAVGDEASVKVNVRLIVATNRAPEDMSRDGTLRQDLFHRLSVARLHLPPLRERGEDVLFLLNHFLEHFSAKFKKSVVGFSAKALRALLDYSYPGNVRELKNIVEYAVMISPRDRILPTHLPVHLVDATLGGQTAKPVAKPEAKPGRPSKPAGKPARSGR